MTENKTYDLADIPLEALRFADKVLKEFRERDEMRKSKFPVWRTIELKDYGSAEAVMKKMRVKRYNSDCVISIRSQIQATNSSDFGKKVALIKTTHDGLGIGEGSSIGQIYARARELGLVPCPVNSAICLLLQHKNRDLDNVIFCSDRYKYGATVDLVVPAITWGLTSFIGYDDHVWAIFDFERDIDWLIFALPYK